MELENVNVFCINCGSASGSMVLEDEQILHCVQQWTAPRLVSKIAFLEYSLCTNFYLSKRIPTVGALVC